MYHSINKRVKPTPPGIFGYTEFSSLAVLFPGVVFLKNEKKGPWVEVLIFEKI